MPWLIREQYGPACPCGGSGVVAGGWEVFGEGETHWCEG